jgi:hypothetical protein
MTGAALAGSMFQPQQKHSHTGHYNNNMVRAHPLAQATRLISCHAALGRPRATTGLFKDRYEL